MTRNLLLLFNFLLLTICFGQVSKENDPTLNPYFVNQKRVQKIKDKDIAFYLNNKAIDGNAKLFFKGKFAISDDNKTFAICDSLTTKNAATRPFYFYVFCRMLELSDGALSEVLGSYCVNYMKKYPCEFVKNLDAKAYDMPLKRWASFVAFELDSKSECQKFEKEIDKKLQKAGPLNSKSWQKLKKEIVRMIEEYDDSGK